MDLKEPKRKRFDRDGQSLARSPLPVLIEEVSGLSACKSLWPMYVGTFNGDCVIISNQDEVSALYNMGFFGKGCYSRGFPCFVKNKAGSPPVLQKRQWNRRKLWMEQLSSSAVDKTANECDNIDQSVDKNSHETPDLSSQQKPQKVFDEIEISDDDEKSSEPGGRKRKHESRLDSIPGKCRRFSNEPALPEATSGTCSKPIEISEDSNSRSRTAENEDNPQPIADADGQNISEDSVIVINDVIDFDKCDFEPRLCNEPLRTVQETLNLSLEEAFFLSYALGCLQVMNLNGVFMTLSEMWQVYNNANSAFTSYYITYHHFRSKGWVVKSGLKYGGDFLLYKKGPKFYHASYIVVIQDVDQPAARKNILKKPLDWTKLLNLQRIAETVSKDVLICHVEWPTGDTIGMFDSPEVVSQFKIQEVIYRRWNSCKNAKDTNNL